MQRQSSARGSLSSARGFGGGDGGGGGGGSACGFGGGAEERPTRHTIDGDEDSSALASAAVLGETMPGSSTLRRQLMGGFPLQAATSPTTATLAMATLTRFHVVTFLPLQEAFAEAKTVVITEDGRPLQPSGGRRSNLVARLLAALGYSRQPRNAVVFREYAPRVWQWLRRS